MTSQPIVPVPDEEHGLDAAKKRLLDETPQPFDVAKVLAQNRVRQEHQQEIHKGVEKKLEHEMAAARLRGDRKKIQQLEKERFQYIQKQSADLDTMKRSLEIEKARLKADGHDKAGK